MSSLLPGGLRDCFEMAAMVISRKLPPCAASFLNFCLTLRKQGKTSKSCTCLGTGAWPESWTPTLGDTFIHTDENHCVGHMHTFSNPSGQPILWGRHLFSPCLSHLWAVPNAEKIPTRQRFTFTWIFLRACGKVVLVLSKLGPCKHKFLSDAVCLQGSPGYSLQIPKLVRAGLAGQLVPITKLKKDHQYQDVLG